MNKSEIRLPAKLVGFYKEIANLAGLPVEVVMTVVLAVGAWRELNKGKNK